jgi:uncharacterized protein YbaA (DUF1428 family)
MTYVDGFVLAVPEKNLDAYKKMATLAGKIWMEYGALEYKECVGDDMEDKIFCANFNQTFKPKKGELVVFAFIVFKSREHRDEVNAKVMADPRLKDCCGDTMSFDAKRMTYGGFKTIVEY